MHAGMQMRMHGAGGNTVAAIYTNNLLYTDTIIHVHMHRDICDC